MKNLIFLIFDLFIIGLIIHWAIRLVKLINHPQIKKIYKILNKVYSPFLDIIQKKLKPDVYIGKGKYFNFSTIILYIATVLTRKLLMLLF